MSTPRYCLFIEVDDGSGPSMLKIRVPTIDHVAQSVQAAEAEVQSRLKHQQTHPWLVKERPVTNKGLIKLLTRKFERNNVKNIQLFVNHRQKAPTMKSPQTDEDEQQQQQQPEVQVEKSVDAVYNKKAEAILRNQLLTQTNKEEKTPKVSALTLPYETVLDKLKVLQMENREGALSCEEYRQQLNALLSNQFAEGLSIDVLNKELRVLYPQLFELKDEFTAVDFAEQEAQHRTVHAMHVLPIVKGLLAEKEAAQQTRETDVSPVARLATRVVTWTSFYEALNSCHAESPLEFPHTLVMILTLHYETLLGALKLVASREHPFVSEKDDSMLPLVKNFSRVLCSVLKERREGDKFGEVRRVMKFVFHRPETLTRGAFVDALIKLMEALDDWTDRTLSDVKRFFERVIFKLGLNESAHICEAVRRIAQDWLTGLETETETSADDMPADETCTVCRKSVRCAGVYRAAELQCASCWFAQRGNDGGVVVRMQNSSTGPTPVPATHLLAHQRNLWENKAGTRHALLPDQRHAVISTNVHEMVTVRSAQPRQPSVVQPLSDTVSAAAVHGSAPRDEEVVVQSASEDRVNEASMKSDAFTENSHSKVDPTATSRKSSFASSSSSSDQPSSTVNVPAPTPAKTAVTPVATSESLAATVTLKRSKHTTSQSEVMRTPEPLNRTRTLATSRPLHAVSARQKYGISRSVTTVAQRAPALRSESRAPPTREELSRSLTKGVEDPLVARLLESSTANRRKRA